MRFVAVNNAPMVANIYRSSDFIFHTPYHFADRFDGRDRYFSSDFGESEEEDTAVNFIPDAYAVPLPSHEERGRGYSRSGINLSGNAMAGHIGSFTVGTYKNVHRHTGGAQVIILGGQGFSLMWPSEGDFDKDLVRVDWGAASLVVPPENLVPYALQHRPRSGASWRCGAASGGLELDPTISTRVGGHQLDYEDEPPHSRPMYEAELAKNGVPLNMPPIQR